MTVGQFLENHDNWELANWLTDHGYPTDQVVDDWLSGERHRTGASQLMRYTLAELAEAAPDAARKLKVSRQKGPWSRLKALLEVLTERRAAKAEERGEEPNAPKPTEPTPEQERKIAEIQARMKEIGL